MRVILALLIGATAAGSAAAAFGASPPAPPPRFVLNQARGIIARAHSTQPVKKAWFVQTRRQDANEILSGAGVNSNQRVYVIVIQGAFTVVRPGPTATGSMRVSVIDSVIDAHTGRETDDGFGRSIPDLARLGTVRSLLPYLRHR